MEAIDRIIHEEIIVEKVNLVRATLNEAHEIKANLTEDSLDYRKIIVDLSDCDYIDSTFLGALVYSYKQIRLRSGVIVLVVGETFLASSFIFRELNSIFKVFRSTREAIAYLSESKSACISG